MVFEVRVAMAHSWVYRMSEAIILAAPSTEALEEVPPKSILGNTIAATIPMMIMTTMTSIKVIPFEFGVRSSEFGVFIPKSAFRTPQLFIVHRSRFIVHHPS
jgi:hypothetical protein